MNGGALSVTSGPGGFWRRAVRSCVPWWACLVAANFAVAQTNRTWNGSASTDWFNPANWTPAGVPASNDTLNVSSGSINLSAPVTIGAQFNWSGGTLSGSPLTVRTNGVLNLVGSGSVTLGAVLTNAGTINWSNSVTFSVYNNGGSPYSGVIWNLAGGLFNIQSDQNINGGYCCPFLNNAGTISKGANTGTTAIGIVFTNSGVVVAQHGTLSFNTGGDIDGTFNAAAGAAINFAGGAFTYSNPPTLGGGGAFQFSGGTLTLASNTIPNLQLAGGTVTLGSGFQGGTITNLVLAGATLAGNNTVSGLFNWTGGTVNGGLQVVSGGAVFWSGGTLLGPVNIANSGVLNLVGGGSVTIGGAVTNAGTINWSNSITLSVYNNNGSPYGGAIWNLGGGLFNIQSDQNMNGGYCCPFLNNAGTISKGANTGTTAIGIVFTNSGVVMAQHGTLSFNTGGDIDGTFNAAAGAAINFAGGAFTYSNPPTLGGGGAFQFSGGTLTLASNTIPNLQLAGGTVTLGSGFQGGTITNLVLAGATLTGNNTVSGLFNWTGGTVNGGLQVANGGAVFWSGGTLLGPVNIANSGVLNLVGGGSVTIGGAVTNAGTINWSNSITLSVYNNNGSPYGGAIWNLGGGLFNIQSDQNINGGYCCPFLNNAGTISKGANTGTTSIGMVFTNSGLVTVQRGTLSFNSGGDIDGTFNAAAGAAINFAGGSFTYSNPPTLGGGGAFQLSGGTLTLASNTIPNLQLVGGTVTLGGGFQGGTITNLVLAGVTLTGNNTVSGLLNWTGGTVNGGLQVASGGAVFWSGGTLLGPVNIANNGVLNLVGGGSVLVGGPVTNAGTINWSNSISLSVYNNNGSPYSGAIWNLGGGLLNIQSDQSMNGAYCCPFLNNAGTISKGANTGTTSIGMVFTNSGLVAVLSGAINFNAGGDIDGTFTAVTGSAINFTGGSFEFGAPPKLNGPGPIQFTGGTLALLSNAVPNLALVGGTVTVATNFQGGTITNLTSGSTLNGSFTVGGVFNCGGGVTGSLLVTNGGTLNFSGGTIGGNLTLTAGATVNWSGGNVNGSVQVPAGAVFNWSGGTAVGPMNVATNGVVNLVGGGSVTVGGPLTNAGIINWSNSISLYVYNNNGSPYSGAIWNLPNGLLNIQSDQGMNGAYCCPFLNNAGTISKGANTGTTSIGIVFTNSGLITVQRGTLNFNSGGDIDGTFTALAGSTINFNAGSFVFSAPPTLNGPGAIALTGGSLTLFNSLVPNLALVGGTLNVGANFQGGSITNLTSGAVLNGTFTVSGLFNCGGGVAGSLGVAGGGLLNFSGGTISGSLSLSNGATGNWSGGNVSGNVLVAGGASLNWSGGGAVGPFNVATNGVLSLVGSGSPILYAPLTNAGTINWSNSPSFYVYNNNGAPYNGAIWNLPGGLFNIQSDQGLNGGYCCPFFNNAGTVRKGAGTGTTTVGITFTNLGSLDVESGTLRFNSTFAQTTGAWTLGLNGPANYGQIAFANSVALGGALTVNLNGGYVPAVNSTFSLVTYPSQTGAFSSVTLPTEGLFWQVSYGAGAVSLTPTNYIAPIVSITNPTNGASFTAPANITLTASATDANAAVTNVAYFQGTNFIGQASASPYTVAWNGVQPGFYSVTARATDAAGATASSAAVSINVYSPINPSTNFFWVGGISSDWFTPGNWSPAGVPGVFDVANLTNGGTITLTNNVAVTSLNVSSGTLGGARNLTISNTFNWAGGTLACALYLPSAATLNLTGNSTLYLQGTLTNAGTVNWSGGTLNVWNCSGPEGPIVNLAGGMWNVQCDQTVNVSCSSASAFFQNAGTVRKSVTTGTSYFSLPFYNTGQVTALSGTLNFNGGGTVGGAFSASAGALIDFSGGSFTAAGAAISGGGLVQFNGGNLTLVADIIPNLALTGGNLYLAPAFQGGAITNLTLSGSTLEGTNTLTGTLNWPGGTIGGPLTVASTGVLNLNGNSTVYLEAPLTNSGTVNWSGGTLNVWNCGGPAGPIVNQAGGVWQIQCDQTLNQSCSSASSYFQNNGTVQKSGTGGTTYFSLPFNNAGLAAALSGTLNFNGGGTIARDLLRGGGVGRVLLGRRVQQRRGGRGERPRAGAVYRRHADAVERRRAEPAFGRGHDHPGGRFRGRHHHQPDLAAARSPARTWSPEP